MQLIPSLDLIGGQVVRLTRGDFSTARAYGDAENVLDSLDLPRGSRLHIVDLEASRRGAPLEIELVRKLARRDLVVQVGGGVRSLDDARRWLDCGVERVVVGTAATSPALLESLVASLGVGRVLPAVDVRDGIVRVAGWERDAGVSLQTILSRIDPLGVSEVLVTDIGRDGLLRGPSFALYRQLAAMTRMKIIASGGVAATSDIVSLARLPNVGGCVIGKALLERRIDLRSAAQRVTALNAIPERIIPCLDVQGGRVVKGVSFENIRDAGDPVACAIRYEQEGADELVLLDITGKDRATVPRVAEALFIPLTAGGGVKTVADFRALLQAGADRVAINTAALRRPELIRECAEEFGVQAVVVSCDAKGGFAAVNGGKEVTDVAVRDWCKRAEELGAGEILLTSIDRDGTTAGFDIDLLRSVTSAVTIGVIASGGAGRPEDFRDAIESGGARAVLAASLFHDGVVTVGDVKRYLHSQGIPIR